MEKKYPGIARQLRKEYDTPSWRSRWGKSFYARRTEQVRRDLANRHPAVYERFLQQELDNPRNQQ